MQNAERNEYSPSNFEGVILRSKIGVVYIKSASSACQKNQHKKTQLKSLNFKLL